MNTNLRSLREGNIFNIASLIPGHEAGHLVLALFYIWPGLSVALGIVYGFRKRPSEALDGCIMLKTGADMSGDLKHNDGS